MTTPSTSVDPTKGFIGRSFEQGVPVIWSFAEDLPDLSTREGMPWLTVVSWPYDGSSDNGMPSEELRSAMLDVERALEPLEESPLSLSAYRRTGNGLKEFVYYVGDRDRFLLQLNELLAGHPQYPLEIKFYEDHHWSDLEKLIADFRKPKPSVQATAVPLSLL